MYVSRGGEHKLRVAPEQPRGQEASPCQAMDVRERLVTLRRPWQSTRCPGSQLPNINMRLMA